jgi:hypothetical protein
MATAGGMAILEHHKIQEISLANPNRFATIKKARPKPGLSFLLTVESVRERVIVGVVKLGNATRFPELTNGEEIHDLLLLVCQDWSSLVVDAGGFSEK